MASLTAHAMVLGVVGRSLGVVADGRLAVGSEVTKSRVRLVHVADVTPQSPVWREPQGDLSKASGAPRQPQSESAGLPERQLSARAAIGSRRAIGRTYVASRDLDRSPLPRSAPDDRAIEGLPSTGGVVRLRLFIEADGMVSSVEILQAADSDAFVAGRLREMFLRTAFIPGRRGNADVASFIDVDVEPDAVRRIDVVDAAR